MIDKIPTFYNNIVKFDRFTMLIAIRVTFDSQESTPSQIKWRLQYKILYLGFLSQKFTIHRTAGGVGSCLLTPLYHFHLFHRHLDIIWTITEEISPLQEIAVVLKLRTFGLRAQVANH